MKTELFKTQSTVNELDQITDYAYERIFKVYKDGDHYAYNILRTINIPEDLDDSVFYYTRIQGSTPWTQVSYDHYDTIRLWWLICLTNKIMNPVILPKPGMIIKVIIPSQVKTILGQITSQL